MSLLSLYRAFLHLSLSCCHRNMLNPKVTGESKYTNTKRVTSKKENGCFHKLALLSLTGTQTVVHISAVILRTSIYL